MRGERARIVGRLTKRPEFLAAATGRRFHTERMSLQGRVRDPDEGLAGLRIGLTVTKRSRARNRAQPHQAPPAGSRQAMLERVMPTKPSTSW